MKNWSVSKQGFLTRLQSVAFPWLAVASLTDRLYNIWLNCKDLQQRVLFWICTKFPFSLLAYQ